MARRVREYTVTTDNRDKNKRFLITEMPADKAERWALRMGFAILNGNVSVPAGVLDAGMAGLASFAHVAVWTLRSLQGMSAHAVEPLLDELMECVQFIPPGAASSTPVPLLHGDGGQIEEVQTRLLLKVEAFQVHVDFSLADVLSSFRNSPAEAAQGQSA